jgi:hypothetical protein
MACPPSRRPWELESWCDHHRDRGIDCLRASRVSIRADEFRATSAHPSPKAPTRSNLYLAPRMARRHTGFLTGNHHRQSSRHDHPRVPESLESLFQSSRLTVCVPFRMRTTPDREPRYGKGPSQEQLKRCRNTVEAWLLADTSEFPFSWARAVRLLATPQPV